MEKSLPNKLSSLRDTMQLMNLSFSAQRDIVDILDEMATRIYSLEEDRRLLRETNRAQQRKIDSLEHRYSELMYRLSDRR